MRDFDFFLFHMQIIRAYSFFFLSFFSALISILTGLRTQFLLSSLTLNDYFTIQVEENKNQNLIKTPKVTLHLPCILALHNELL